MQTKSRVENYKVRDKVYLNEEHQRNKMVTITRFK